MPFLLVRNDITQLHVDAIVNPANEDLLEGSGTSRAIYVAAGEEQLKNACENIGHCKLGKAVVTDAFNLNSKYIIHAVGPVWNGGNTNEKDNLYSAYMEALKLAEEYKCESIAFPLLSSGNYRYPKDQAMKVAVSAFSEYLMEHEMTIYLVLYDRDSLAISQKLFTSIDEYIDDNYVDENDEIFHECREIRNYARQADLCEYCDEEDRGLESTTCLEPKRTLDSLMKHLDETFSQMLLRLIDERELKDSTVYKKANIDRRHFSKIRNDIDYTPTKKTVFAFVIALELSMDEAIDLLNKAGFAFSNSSKFDVIISFFIEKRNFDIFEINEVLFTYGQPILGE